MRIRIIAIAIAAVLAVVGAVVLVGAFRVAGQSATGGKDMVTVLVVKHEVPAGTSAADLGDAIGTESVPRAYVAIGAANTAADLAGKVASVTLEPGEQVLQSRFVTPSELASTGGTAAVPAGMQQVSVSVDPQRTAGGRIGVGDHVGVFVSLDATGDQPAATKLLLNDVLVTSVSGATVQSSTSEGTSSTGTTNTASVTGAVLVTVALTADDAQQLVYGAEFGRVWLSLQTAKSSPVTVGPATRTGLVG
jgi:pilus assembly protein CpaB